MYIVVENTPGYMPESEPAEFETWENVLAFAEDTCREWEDLGWKVSRYFIDEDGYVYWDEDRDPGVIAEADDGSLGRVLDVFRSPE